MLECAKAPVFCYKYPSMESGFDDPSDFKSTELQTLDEHVRCPICKEIYKDIMMLSTCSHSFCALCIRRCLSAEQVCPKCRKQSHEGQLIHNYDLDNVVRSWKQSRKLILQLENNNFITSTTSSIAPFSSQQSTTPMVIDDDLSDDFIPSDHFASNTTTTITRRSTRLHSKQDTPQPQQHPKKVILANTCQTEQPVANSIVNIDAAGSGPNTSETKLTSSSIVACPVCAQQMKFALLDKHIDQCLSSPSPSTTPVKKNVNLGKKPVKQVYNMLNDKQLTELLRSFNLPDHGDRASKIWRHKEYISLYNANADSNEPVSAQVLVQRLIATERLHTADRHNQMKRKAADLEEHKAKYADHFSQLIQTAKKNKATAKDEETSKKQS